MYCFSQGLGKSGQGRVVPVEITILPAGKSLDACAEIREGKKTQSGKRRKRNKRIKQATKEEEQMEEPANMFEFLNTRIFKKGIGLVQNITQQTQIVRCIST